MFNTFLEFKQIFMLYLSAERTSQKIQTDFPLQFRRISFTIVKKSMTVSFYTTTLLSHW